MKMLLEKTTESSFVLRLLVLLLLDPVLSDPQPLVYNIVEEQDPGTLVADIGRDAHVFQPTRNSRRPAQSPSFMFVRNQSRFVIDSHTGIIRTASVLDRDTICPRSPVCSLEVDVAIHQQPRGSPNIVKVFFKVMDINDNDPKFPKPHVHETVSEGTQVGSWWFPIQTANDPDSPENGVQRYELVADSDTFELYSEKGEDGFVDLRLVLKKPLDREKREYYNLKVVAVDGGKPPRSGVVVVHINIGDVNDNSPVFTNATYRMEIGENTPPHHSLMAVSATDADVGDNGAVTYSLSPKTAAQFGSNFSVDPKSGIIALLTPIDYEKTQQVLLEVVAVDGAEWKVSATATVSIDIKDANDNTPEIRLESAPVQSGSTALPVVYVQEHSEKGRFVAHLAVTDADSGVNGRVKCSLTSPQFRLVQKFDTEFIIETGDAVIDREYADRHQLVVTCYDMGTPVRSSAFNVVVVVEDVNDNKPMFGNDTYWFTIGENNLVNAFVGAVKATDRDKDKNGEVSYQIQQNASSLFAIDNKTGNITALKTFDRELNDSYRFRVYARDHGPEKWHSDAIVLVHVTDKDDEGPHFFQNRYIFEVADNTSSHTKVGQVSAYDRDQAPNNRFNFYLENSRPSEPSAASLSSAETSDIPFEVRPSSGAVYTRSKIDRKQRSVYNFTVVVQSQSPNPRRQKDRAHVIVRVIEPGRESSSQVRLFGLWWQRAFSGLGLAVFLGCLTGSVVLVALVCVAIAAFRKRRKKTKTSTEAIRNCSFWSNPDALTPPPSGSDQGKETARSDDVYNAGRRPPSSSTDDVSDEDYIHLAGNAVFQNSGQCHWCSSTDLDIPAPPSASCIAYDQQMTLPREFHGQSLGSCGFRPIGDATSSDSWRETRIPATPPIECRRQPYNNNHGSPMHMASMYLIKHNTGSRSGTLERRTVRFQGNTDNDVRRMYADPSAATSAAYQANPIRQEDMSDFPPPFLSGQ